MRRRGAAPGPARCRRRPGGAPRSAGRRPSAAPASPGPTAARAAVGCRTPSTAVGGVRWRWRRWVSSSPARGVSWSMNHSVLSRDGPSHRSKARSSATWSQSRKNVRARGSVNTYRVRFGSAASSSPTPRITSSNPRVHARTSPAPVGHERDGRFQQVEHLPDAGPDVAAGRGGGPRRAGAHPAVGDLRQVPQVVALGGVEAQGVGDGVDDARGRAAVPALLDPGQVLDADAGPRRQLRPPQPRHTPPLPDRQPQRLRLDAVAGGTDEVPQRSAHATSLRAGPGRVTGSAWPSWGQPGPGLVATVTTAHGVRHEREHEHPGHHHRQRPRGPVRSRRHRLGRRPGP